MLIYKEYLHNHLIILLLYEAMNTMTVIEKYRLLKSYTLSFWVLNILVSDGERKIRIHKQHINDSKNIRNVSKITKILQFTCSLFLILYSIELLPIKLYADIRSYQHTAVSRVLMVSILYYRCFDFILKLKYSIHDEFVSPTTQF